MRRLKVVQIVEDLKVGGIETIIKTMACNFNKDRYDVSVLCLAKGGDVAEELLERGIEVDILGMKYHCTPFFLFKLVRRLRRLRTDIVHCHGYTGATVGRTASFLARVPVIISHLHTTFEEYTRKQIFTERVLNSVTDRTICCSKSTLRAAASFSGAVRKRGAVVYNGVEQRLFEGESEAAAVRGEFGIGASHKVVGCIASYTKNKGYETVIKAAGILKKKVPASDMPKFLFVGEGNQRPDLEGEVKVLGVEDDVIFTGFRRDISRLTQAMDVILLASEQREGLGICLIEGMAGGKPVIGTRIVGIPEVIKEGLNGLLIEPGDYSAMARAIREILEDGKKAAGMGEAGRKLYLEKFTAKDMMSRIESIYGEVCQEKGIRLEKTERITAALIVKNEIKYIRQCLESLDWVDEIVVLDGYSTDGTLDIIREYDVKLFQKRFEGFPKEREYLLTKASNDWVFMVDADMVIPKELRLEIERSLTEDISRYSAFTFRFLNIYLGKYIRHCGWYDPNNPRLFNKRKGRYDTQMKYIDSFIPDGQIKVMKNHILHYGFETVQEHYLRVDRYAALNAEDLRTKGLEIRIFNMPYYFIFKPLAVFIFKYFFKRGFLDGTTGLVLCLMAAVTYQLSYFKLWEAQRR